MGQPTKRDQQVRELLESILAELAIVKRVMPVHELRINQVKDRTGLDSLLAPALDEVRTVNAGIETIGSRVRAELQAMSQANKAK